MKRGENRPLNWVKVDIGYFKYSLACMYVNEIVISNSGVESHQIIANDDIDERQREITGIAICHYCNDFNGFRYLPVTI